MSGDHKFTKEWYRREIVEKKKSLPQIAAERDCSVIAIRKEIRSLYSRPAWANKLIGQAAANEAEKRNMVNTPAVPTRKKKSTAKSASELPYEMRLALKRGIAIVDSNYADKFYGDCKKIEHLIMPEFCLNEMRSMAKYAPTEKERQAIERKIRYFEKNAELILVKNLSEIAPDETTAGFKPRNFNFARYVQYVWQIHGFKVPYLTCASQAITIIKNSVKLEVTQE